MENIKNNQKIIDEAAEMLASIFLALIDEKITSNNKKTDGKHK
jgi:hypothetical protein